MNHFLKISLSAALMVIAFVPAAYANQEKPMTRASFAKLVQREISTKKKPLLRPKAFLPIAEAAVILKNAFNLEIPEFTPYEGTWPDRRDRAPWYEPYIRALEEKNAIPVSFWKPGDIVTEGEAREMISRLKNNITSEPSMTFEALQLQKNRYRAQDLLRLHGDFTKPVEGKIVTPQVLKALREPGTYYIDDIDASEQNDLNYCHNYYTQSGVRGNVTVITKEQDATIIIEALSTDYCVFPFPSMQPGECPPNAEYNDDPRCNRGQAKSYTLILKQRGNELFVQGAETNRVRITRAPIEQICREFADGCPKGYYDYTKVDTAGTLSIITTTGSETWSSYKTKWQSIFTDLRGVPFILFEKTLPDGSYFQKYYEAPGHNRNSWGHGLAAYKDCIAKGSDFHFCIKRDGNNFVIASPYELGDRMSIWIDTYFRR